MRLASGHRNRAPMLNHAAGHTVAAILRARPVGRAGEAGKNYAPTVLGLGSRRERRWWAGSKA